MTWRNPIFWALGGFVVFLHFYNGEQRELAKEAAQKEAELKRQMIERRRLAPLSVEERAAQITLKRQQAKLWEEKLAKAISEEAAAGAKEDASLSGRRAHALERLSQIRETLVELENTK